jgi:hypothetical protein
MGSAGGRPLSCKTTSAFAVGFEPFLGTIAAVGGVRQAVPVPRRGPVYLILRYA